MVFNSMRSFPLSRSGCRLTSKSSQRGLSMLDFIIYIGVAVVIISLILYVASIVRDRTDAVASEQEITVLGEATRAAFATQNSYGTADITTFLANSNDVPGSLRKTVSGSTTTLTNKWNGAVTVTGNTTSFSIDYKNMPKSVCNKLLPRLLKPNWTSVTVGSTAVTIPVSPVQADAACAASNDVVLVGG